MHTLDTSIGNRNVGNFYDEDDWRDDEEILSYDKFEWWRKTITVFDPSKKSANLTDFSHLYLLKSSDLIRL